MSGQVRFIPRLKLAAFAALAAGCATNGPLLPPGTSMVVSSPRGPLYKYGPAQSFGADLTLDYGTKVTLIERSFGYYRVMTENGISGYVASDDLDVLPPEPIKKPEPVSRRSTTRRTYSGPIRRSSVESIPGDPLFDINDVPLPMPEEPANADKKPGATPPKKPSFRANPTPKPSPPTEKNEP